jgi:arylsulfatase A-like enzyme
VVTSKMLRRLTHWLAILLCALGILPASAQTEGEFKGVIGPTDKESKPYYPEPTRPKAGSPNVVYIVLDDVGFADLGCYGSEIATPNLDQLAAGGLRYNNFHTRAICSPTRAALLTGRNSHSVGVRTVSNVVNGFPNGRGYITPAATTLAEILHTVGYSTFALGKWHLVPLNQSSPSGPFDQWPVQRGFEHFYGFLDGLADQYRPELVLDNTFVEPPKQPGYHLSADLVDKSIQYLRQQKAATPEKPFFLYLAFGAAHAPHQAPKAFVDKYVPVFEKGWDKTREDRLAKQKQLGITPANAALNAPNPGIKAWSSLSNDEKRLYVRFQAAFAGFLDHTDVQIGRLIQHLKDSGQLENTIVVVISDNGASQEGDFEGFTNIVAGYNRISVPLENKLKVIDDIGTERSESNYPLGWAQAGNTPFQYYKQTVHGGGTNDPLIVSWPKGISDKGGIRSQFVDVIDITPTILDLTGIEAPKTYHDVPQKPLEGASIAATFKDPNAPNPRNVQYFEQGGNRAIWNDGWKAVTLHKAGTDFDKDVWELYDLKSDFSESKNLAAQNPDKLKQLEALWWSEARKYGVLPLDGRNALQVALENQKRTDLLSNRSTYVYYPGQGHLLRDVTPNTANRSYAISAYVDRPSAKSDGVLVAFGSSGGGYSFFVKDGKLVFDYNAIGKHIVLTSDRNVPVGKAILRYVFTRTDNFKGTAALYVDAQKVAEQVISLPPSLFIAWEGLDVGRDSLSPVSPLYANLGDFAFPTGALEKVVYEIKGQ